MADAVELKVELGVYGLHPGHRALDAAVDEFLSDAHDSPGLNPEIRDRQVDRHAKGALQEILITLGPAGAAALVRIVRLWLQRDRNRSITVQIAEGHTEPIELKATGENVSLDALEQAIRDALKAKQSDEKE